MKIIPCSSHHQAVLHLVVPRPAPPGPAPATARISRGVRRRGRPDSTGPHRPRPGRGSVVGIGGYNHEKSWDYHCKITGKSWENHWKIMGKSLENHGNIMGLSLQNHWKIMGISWENHGNIMGKSWENHGNIMGISWEYHGNMVACKIAARSNLAVSGCAAAGSTFFRRHTAMWRTCWARGVQHFWMPTHFCFTVSLEP